MTIFKSHFFFFFFVLQVIGLNLYSQSVIFVNPDVDRVGNGASWNTAFNNLHEALSKAEYGDEIWLVEGTYYTSTNGDRFRSFNIENSISIRGGFLGHEKNLNERKPNVLSILSGEIGMSDLITDNAYHVLRIDNPNITFNLDYVTVRGAYGDFIGEGDFFLDEVGAILIDNPAGSKFDIEITRVKFENNFAADKGASVFVQDKSSSSTEIKIRDCNFEKNHAAIDGSAFFGDFFSDEVDLRIERSRFTKMAITDTAFSIIQTRMRGQGNRMLIDDCSFDNNQSNTTDAMIAVSLPGLTQFTITNCIFSNNQYGQLLIVNGSSVPHSIIKIDHVDIINNVTLSSPVQVFSSSFGEDRTQVFIDHTSIKGNQNDDTWILIDLHEIILKSFDNNSFVGNKGGPLFLNPIYEDLTINNILVAHNSFLDVDFSNQFVFKNFDNYNISFNNGTFAFNDGINGTIVRSFLNTNNGKIGTMAFNNCIFYANEDFGASSTPEKLVFSKYMSVNFNNCLMDNLDCETSVTLNGTGSVHCNESTQLGSFPYFKSPNDFNLSFCSPAIDAGATRFVDGILQDLSGEDRIINDSVDIGALEYKDISTIFGFNCAQGLIYSDWISDFGSGTEFELLDIHTNSLANHEVFYLIRTEAGCLDTIRLSTREIAYIEFYGNETSIDAEYGDTVCVYFRNYTANKIEYYIFHEDELVDSWIDAERIYFKPDRSGTYKVKAFNEFGCYYEEEIEIAIEKFRDLVYVPNAFSPNNDGIHDDLVIYAKDNINLLITQLRVFDRWGNVLIQLDNVTLGDGLIILNSNKVNELGLGTGVYTYSIKAEYNLQDIYQYGNFAILN